MPMMYLSHQFQRDLEDDFVVVHWDQRGAGKSYNKDVPIESMNVEQFILDTHELTQLLRERFNQEKVYLIGHSWGSYLGMIMIQRYPELFYAYVGVGQVVHEEKGKEIQEQFIRKRAIEMGNSKVIEELDANEGVIFEDLLFQFGGELHNETDWTPLLMAGLNSPEYSLFDYYKIPTGSSFSSKHMKYNAIQGELIDNVTSVKVPVYFFTGRYDYTSPSELVELYYAKLNAPKKRIVWFERSAHFPFFEEPEKFTDEMKTVHSETYLNKENWLSTTLYGQNNINDSKET
jgi:pimeloyl-ACP methyl ester carboxylesterase